MMPQGTEASLVKLILQKNLRRLPLSVLQIKAQQSYKAAIKGISAAAVAKIWVSLGILYRVFDSSVVGLIIQS